MNNNVVSVSYVMRRRRKPLSCSKHHLLLTCSELIEKSGKKKRRLGIDCYCFSLLRSMRTVQNVYKNDLDKKF